MQDNCQVEFRSLLKRLPGAASYAAVLEACKKDSLPQAIVPICARQELLEDASPATSTGYRSSDMTNIKADIGQHSQGPKRFKTCLQSGSPKRLGALAFSWERPLSEGCFGCS